MMKRILTAGVFILGLYAGADAATRYHVSKTGSDGNAGTSWNQAWLTLTNVNDPSVFRSGDTVIIGAGIWREELYMMGGTGTAKTCYMDSAWSVGTYDSRVAWIYGSDSLHTWTRIGATNVYICDYVPTVMNSYVGIWQGDSILFRQADSADVNAPGESWYGNNHIIAYVYGGDDPDNHQMEIGQRTCVWRCMNDGTNLYRGQDNTTLIGLGFKYSYQFQLTDCGTGRDELGWDSCIISHCYFGCNTGSGGNNASLIYVGRCTEYDPSGSGNLDGCDYNHIVACSVGMNYTLQATLPQQSKSYNGAGMNFYSLRFSTIDSNIFWGHLRDDGALKFKVIYDGDDGGATYDTIRFNTFKCDSDALIHMRSGSHHFAIYGNIFHNTATAGDKRGVYMEYSAAGVSGAGYHKIYNNTFYEGTHPMLCEAGQSDYSWPYRHNEFKYNVMYRTTGFEIVSFDSADFWVDVDSNMYYAASGSNDWESDGTTYTFAQWQGIGFDVHGSDDVNPGFDDAAAGDFTRSGVPPEMDRSYGDETWRLYGAVQEPVNCDPPDQTTLVSPTSGSTYTIRDSPRDTLTLSWQLVAGTNLSYRIQVSRYSGFDACQIDEVISGNSLAVAGYGDSRLAGSQAGVMYYWRVDVRSEPSCSSGWTDPWTFLLVDQVRPNW